MEIRLTLLIEQDGQPLPDMPVIRRYNVNQSSGLVNLAAPADNNTSSFHGIGAVNENPLVVFYLTSDQTLNLNLNQFAAINASAGFVLLMAGVNLTQGTPANNVTYNNPSSATTANLGILAGGT